MRKEAWSAIYLVLIVGAALRTEALPAEQGRKFNVKPNNPKKVDYMNYAAEKAAAGSSQQQSAGNSVSGGQSPQTASTGSAGAAAGAAATQQSGSKLAKPFQVQKSESMFSWSNILSMALQFVYNLMNPPKATEKNDNMSLLQGGEFSWTKVISVILKVALAGLGTDAGIDKSDTGPATPLESMLAAGLTVLMGSKDPGEVAVMAKQAGELINLGITLLDALRTSFSQRSLRARSLGGDDRFSEAAMASLSLLKGYAQTYQTHDDICRQKAICLANQNCVSDAPHLNSMYCKLASHFMTIGLGSRTDTSLEYFTDAARRGRLLEDCQSLYLCNEI